MIKVLDGTPINGHFWVFVASMTDVEFDLRAVDHQTGTTWSHQHTAGTFLSLGDTTAFPDLP